jgi:hypothetical protein
MLLLLLLLLTCAYIQPQPSAAAAARAVAAAALSIAGAGLILAPIIAAPPATLRAPRDARWQPLPAPPRCWCCSCCAFRRPRFLAVIRAHATERVRVRVRAVAAAGAARGASLPAVPPACRYSCLTAAALRLLLVVLVRLLLLAAPPAGVTLVNGVKISDAGAFARRCRTVEASTAAVVLVAIIAATLISIAACRPLAVRRLAVLVFEITHAVRIALRPHALALAAADRCSSIALHGS